MTADALWTVTSGDGTGHHSIDCVYDGHKLTLWTPTANRRRFMRLTGPSEGRSDVQVSACPYLEDGSRRLHADSSCVWAKTETRGSVMRLDGFRPRPTLVLQEGSTVRKVAFWWLEKPLSPEDCERVNKHLAHHLGTKKLHASTGFAYYAPGTWIKHGRKRPVEVSVAGCTGEVYRVGQVCRSLPREIPDPLAWRKAMAA